MTPARRVAARRHAARRARARRALAAGGALAAVAAAGCARYAPAAPAALRAGARVRVALTEQGTAALARTPVGPGVVGLEGAWAGARGDTARVRVERLLTGAGVEVAWGGAAADAEVALAPADVRGLERRAADRGRTALAVAGGVAAAVAFLAALRAANRGGGGGSGGGVTPF